MQENITPFDESIRLIAVIGRTMEDADEAARAIRPRVQVTAAPERPVKVLIGKDLGRFRGYRPDLILVSHGARFFRSVDFADFGRFGRGSIPKPVWLLNPDGTVRVTTDTTKVAEVVELGWEKSE